MEMMGKMSKFFLVNRRSLCFMLLTLPFFLRAQDTVKILYGDKSWMYRVDDPHICNTDTAYHFQMGIEGNALVIAYYDSIYQYKAAEVAYVNGKRQGFFCIYNKFSGDIVYRILYVDDFGFSVESYYCSGGCQSVIQYNQDGIQSGTQVSFYENGQIASVEYLLDGRYVGTQSYWYENGQLRLLLPSPGSTPARGREYWVNGRLKSEFIVINNSTQYLNRYDSLGNLIADVNSKRWVEYHRNGRIAIQGGMKKGFMHGTYTLYDTSGSIIETKQYDMGKLEGNNMKYKQGVLSYSCEYKSGLKNGKEITYDGQGKVLNVASWKMGQLLTSDQRGRKVFH